MDKNIRLYHDKKAVEKISEIPIVDMGIKCFINQQRADQGIFCLIYCKDNEPVSFALFSTMNYDPLGFHTRPKLINYIYTLDKRKCYASRLIAFAKQNWQFTAFCSNEESVKLFTKNSCFNYGKMNGSIMIRYP